MLFIKYIKAFTKNFWAMVAFLLFVCFSVQSQQESTNDFIEKRDTSFVNLKEFFKNYRRDTVQLKKLLNVSLKADYDEGASYAYDMLGIAYRNKSNYKRAIQLHNKALEISRKILNVDFKVSSLNMLGVAYRRMDEIRPALEYHKSALEIAESSGKKTETNLRNIAVSYNSIGNLYLTLRQGNLAAEQFQKALSIEKQVDNKLGIAINYQNLGGIFEDRNLLDSALANYRKSLKYNEAINSNLGRMICNNSIAQVLLEQQKPTEALNLVLPSMKIAEEFEDSFYIAWTSKNIGWAYLELGKLAASKTYLQRCITVATKNNLRSYLAEAYKYLSLVYEKQGDYKNALLYDRKKSEYEEQYLNEENQQYVADLILKYDSEKKKSQIELLEKENELVNVKLSQNRKLLILPLVLGLLTAVTLYVLYRQYKISNERQLLEVEQKMMRSQMNPHFIFNSLNSIKLYIIKNEKDKAVYYLNKFSKLIRTILANSKEKEITLADELATMKLYLNIENIRFSNKINYSINVDERINPDSIKIPSLILQPFIENAIWHGLSLKEGEKNLDIHVYASNDDRVVIKIIDNGIGRKRSGEIKARKTLNQASVGIELTTERLKNFFKEKGI
ncbi:MAG: tetratricopeptide (TPR) repeat protein, partial [Spirosomataceae bacterium]